MRKLTTLLLSLMLLLGSLPAEAKSKGDVNGDGLLRILAIGNSFSDDGMEHLPSLLKNLGIENVELARLYVGGCTLQRHADFIKKGESPYTFYHSKAGENIWVKATDKYSLSRALEMGEWDIITMQQASGVSGQWESFQPHLDELVATVKAAQPQAQLAWQMTWAYSTDSNHREYPNYDKNQQTMWSAITSTVKTMLESCDYFYKVIPTGTTIQSLRQSPVNNAPMDFTRDGYHLDYGAGRYAAACTWYETLIKPFSGKSMQRNTLRVYMGKVDAASATAAYCQRAAAQASKRPFQVREIKHTKAMSLLDTGKSHATIVIDPKRINKQGFHALRKIENPIHRDKVARALRQIK